MTYRRRAPVGLKKLNPYFKIIKPKFMCSYLSAKDAKISKGAWPTRSYKLRVTMSFPFPSHSIHSRRDASFIDLSSWGTLTHASHGTRMIGVRYDAASMLKLARRDGSAVAAWGSLMKHPANSIILRDLIHLLPRTLWTYNSNIGRNVLLSTF